VDTSALALASVSRLFPCESVPGSFSFPDAFIGPFSRDVIFERAFDLEGLKS
jgi:hypothetical protein